VLCAQTLIPNMDCGAGLKQLVVSRRGTLSASPSVRVMKAAGMLMLRRYLYIKRLKHSTPWLCVQSPAHQSPAHQSVDCPRHAASGEVGSTLSIACCLVPERLTPSPEGVILVVGRLHGGLAVLVVDHNRLMPVSVKR
jgi:hypothetical protein